MPAPDFLDSNVLIYAYDVSNPAKQRIARALVGTALAGGILMSTQVLAEFAAALLHKISPAAHPADLTLALDALGPIKLISPDGDIVRRAVEAHAAYGCLHFYDGMIIAAAERAGCNKIWSEDFNPDQKYFGIAVANPFS